MPDTDVAKAIPLSFIGKMSTAFKDTFITSAKTAVLAGVTVSFKAKKQDCNILVAP